MRRRTGARGQALAEFALIAPILFLLIFGVIQVGLIMASQNGLVNGVRDATRKAATYRINEESFNGTSFPTICGNVTTQLTDDLSTSIPGFDAANLSHTIAYEWKQDPDSSQWFLVAHIAASYRNVLYVPLVSVLLDFADGLNDDRLRLDASEQMRVENPALAPTDTSAQVC